MTIDAPRPLTAQALSYHTERKERAVNYARQQNGRTEFDIGKDCGPNDSNRRERLGRSAQTLNAVRFFRLDRIRIQSWAKPHSDEV